MEENLFVHCLNRAGEVAMTVGKQFVLLSRGTQKAHQGRRIEGPDMGAAALPLIGDLFLVVTEEAGVEREGATIQEPYDLAHLGQEFWRAIGSEPHDFVFITVIWKSQELRQCLVENTQRMRKIDTILYLDGGVMPDPPGRARKVAEAVDRGNRRLAKRGDKKTRCQMRHM